MNDDTNKVSGDNPGTAADLAELMGQEALTAAVAALNGAAGEAMQEATGLAKEHLHLLLTRAWATGRKGAARRVIAGLGLDAVSKAITAYEGGEAAPDADAAWLLLLLHDVRVRDDAWSRMVRERNGLFLRLWADLTRRVRPRYVAPAASLLAFAAWQCGNTALADVAVGRALLDDPRYSMAMLLRSTLDAGVPTHQATPPMTPQEVAASYAHEDGDAADDHGPEAEPEEL